MSPPVPRRPAPVEQAPMPYALDDVGLWRNLAPLLPYAVSTAAPALIPAQRRPTAAEYLARAKTKRKR